MGAVGCTLIVLGAYVLSAMFPAQRTLAQRRALN
jgi:hypothetical protein